MMQPNVAAKLFGDATLHGIGVLTRTLLVAPESTAGTHGSAKLLGSATCLTSSRVGGLLGLLDLIRGPAADEAAAAPAVARAALPAIAPSTVPAAVLPAVASDN